MSDMESAAGAKATVTLEIFGLGSWGRTCTLEQVYKQGAVAAEGRIRKHFEGNVSFRITSIEVTTISTTEKK